MDDICRDLKSVVVNYEPAMSGEAKRLLNWAKCCLLACDERMEANDSTVEFSLSDQTVESAPLSLEFVYSDKHYFKWTKFKEGSLGEIKSYLGSQEEHITTRVKPLSIEQSIGEALFF
jgi:hypothetical protein